MGDVIAELRAHLALVAMPVHAPGLAELHDANNRCIGLFVDTDPVPQEERPVPDVDEGERIAQLVAAALMALPALLDVAEAARELEEALCTTAVGGPAHHELCDRREQARDALRAALARLEGK